MKYLLSIIIVLYCYSALAFPPGFIGAVATFSSSAWVEKFSDSFTGSNGALLSSSWVNDTGAVSFTIFSNAAKIDYNEGRAHISTAGFTTKQAAEVSMLSDQAMYSGPCINYTSLSLNDADFNGYCAFYNSGTVYLYERNGTSWASSASYVRAFTSGDVLRIENLDGVISAKVNGLQVATFTDATVSGGQPALRGHSSTSFAVFDNFKAYSYE